MKSILNQDQDVTGDKTRDNNVITGKKLNTDINTGYVMHNELVNEINKILTEFKCPTITKADIRFSGNIITNLSPIPGASRKISDILYEHYYPQSAAGPYAHFTGLNVLDSILEHGKIWLTSTIKRKEDAEFGLFYRDHDMKGFEQARNPAMSEDDLMRDLFYLSLTKNKDSKTDIERGLWRHFGNGGTGVKLVFDIIPKCVDFRKVLYNHITDPSKTLLGRLNIMMMEKYRRPFVFSSVSKFGAFYIFKGFQDEYETRLLIKKGAPQYSFPFMVKEFNGNPYIELDFNSEFADIKLVGVQGGVNCDMKVLKSIIDNRAPHVKLIEQAVSL